MAGIFVRNGWKLYLISFLFLFSSGNSFVYGFERGPIFTVDDESVCKTDPQSACEYLVATRVTDAAEILNVSAAPGDSTFESYPQIIPAMGSRWRGPWDYPLKYYPTAEIACEQTDHPYQDIATFSHVDFLNPFHGLCIYINNIGGNLFGGGATPVLDGCPDSYQDNGNGTCVLQAFSEPTTIYQCQAQIVDSTTSDIVDLPDVGTIYPVCNLGDPVSTIASDSICNSSDSMPDKGANLGKPNCENRVSNPVNSATGNKYAEQTDIALSTGLTFSRYYNSDSLSGNMQIGIAWRHSFQRSLFTNPETVTATRTDGKLVYFRLDGSDWINQLENNEHLTQIDDGNGNITGWQLTTVDDTIETYDVAGNLLSITDRNGRTQVLTYDANNRLITVTDDIGRTLSFTYDGSSRITTLTDPAGSLYSYGYDTAGNLISVTYPDGKIRIYHYNEPAYTSGEDLPFALTGITDENGIRYATYTYDTQGRAIITEHANGADRHQLSYSTDGSNTVVTDPLGSQYTHQFQTILGVAKSTGQSQPAGSGCSAASSATTYDVNGNVASRADFNGNKTCYTHGLNRNLEIARVEGLAAGSACPGDLVNYTPAAGSAERKILTDWHIDFRLPIKVTEVNRETTITYDTYSNVTQLSIRDTGSNETRTWNTSYTYHPTVPGVIVQRIEDGPRTDVSDLTTIDYYAPDAACTGGHFGCRSQVMRITNALGHITDITHYNAHGQPEQVVDANNLTTTLAYDLRQRLISRVVGTETTTYQYDGVGQLTQLTRPDGSAIHYTYDAAHRLTDITDSLGNAIRYTLDAAGNRTKEEIFDSGSALAQTRQQEFDALSRLWKMTGAQNQVTELAYDANGNLKQTIDPLLHTATSQFDALDRLIQANDPIGGQTLQQQDALDQITQVTDPKGIATSYTTNALGDVLQEVSADRGTTTYTYDAAGNQLTRTDARGVVQTTSYDALNRPVIQSYSVVSGIPATGNITWTYDSGANGIGQLTSMSDESGSTSYQYNAYGRLTGKTQTVSHNGENFAHTLAYQYNASGQLTRVTYPSGTQIDYTYGADGRPVEVRINGNVLIQNIAYRPFGEPQSWNWSTGQVYSRSYDLDGRLTQHLLGADTQTLTYDAASRITNTTHTDPIYNRTYQYDALDRLTHQANHNSTRLWSYDANSNRISEQSGAVVYPYTIDASSNRLLSVAGPVAKTYTYDAAGNTLNDGTIAYTWNAAGRMSQATISGNNHLYQYNGLGERIHKGENLSGSVQRFFVYDSAGHLIGEYQENLTTPPADDWELMQETVWLGNIPIAVLKKSVAANIVDNQDTTQTSSTGTWNNSSGTNPYSGNSVYANENGESFQWNPDLSANGTYDVAAWWTYHSNRDTTVTYKVHHVNGVTDVTVNQGNSALGGQWNELGNFTLDQSSYVELIHDGGTTSTSSADAIRFTPNALSVHVVDNQDGTQTSSTGTWNNSSGVNPYSGNSVYANENGESFQWNPDLSANGTYDVAAWWTYHNNRDTTVTYKVHHVNGITDVTVNQGDSTLGGQWNELGNFTLDQSSYVEMIHDGGTTSTSSADAIRFTNTVSAGVVQTYYIYADHLNTPRMIVDQDDTTVWRWSDNRAFGNMLPDEDPDGDDTLFEYNLRFAGQYFDSETNLHYNYFRDYEPETGRYLSNDPIGLAGGLNTYGYALQNPLTYTDPTGEVPFLACALNPLCRTAVSSVIGAITGALIDTTLQLASNGGNFECVNTREIAFAAAASAVPFGAAGALSSKVLGKFLSNAASQPSSKLGLTKAGHALDKHAAGQRSTGTFPALSGNAANRNKQAQQIVDDILGNSKSEFRILGRGGLEVRSPNGQGIRFNKDGSFSSFVD